MKNSLEFILCGLRFSIDWMVDSRALFDTIATLQEPLQCSLRKVVAPIRDAFESVALNGVKWIQGITNLSDVLTKPNTIISIRINQMLAEGIWDAQVDGLVHIILEKRY